jgi:hypothetical protein
LVELRYTIKTELFGQQIYVLVSTSIHLYCAYRKVNKFSFLFSSIILLAYGIVISCGEPSHQVGIVVADVALISSYFCAGCNMDNRCSTKYNQRLSCVGFLLIRAMRSILWICSLCGSTSRPNM